MINFPEEMTEDDVKNVLKQFEPKKDDRFDKLLQAVYELAKKQVVQDTVVKTIEVPKIVEKTVVQTVEVPVKTQVPWNFEIEREGERIKNVRAIPDDS